MALTANGTDELGPYTLLRLPLGNCIANSVNHLRKQLHHQGVRSGSILSFLNSFQLGFEKFLGLEEFIRLLA